MFSTFTGSGFRTGFSPASWNDNAWHYVVVTYDGSQTTSGVTMYYDGVQQSISGDISGTAGTLTYTQNAEIGSRHGGADFYDGEIDELVIYNKVLTNTEVSALYNSGSGDSTPDTNGLIAHYDFEQTGNTLENQALTTATWTMEPTFTDDFSKDKNWTVFGTQLTIDNTANFRIDYAMKRDGADHYADKDMQDADCLNGVNLSDEAFVVRGHMTNTASTGTSYSADGYFAVRSASASDSTAQDYLAFEFSWGTGAGIRAIAGDGIAIDSATNYTSYFATPITATMDIYLQISRSGNTATFGIYSDSAYTTLVEELSLTIASTYTGLRYLSLVTRNSSTQDSTMTGYLDDIEIYNGVNTVN